MIETTILYKLPRLSREEIQAMLEVHDIRETRLFQEALQEGREEEIKKRDPAIARMAAAGMPPAQIASFLEVNVEKVRQVLAETHPQ